MRLLPAVLLALLAAPALAQPAADTAAADSAAAPLVRLELADRTVVVGTVVREDSAAVVLRTVSGVELTVPAAQVRRRGPFEGEVAGGRLVRYDPNRTRLLFAPTARPLGRGAGYVADYYLVLPFVAYGLSDRVSLAGGTLLAPTLFGRVLYVAPKVTVVSRPGVDAAVGAFLGYVRLDEVCDGECDGGVYGGIAYAVGTVGGPRRAATVGVGVPFGEGEVAGGALLLIGGELQVSNGVKLLTENYVPLSFEDLPGAGLSAGVRFFGERLAADLALVTSTEALVENDLPSFPFAPFASVSVTFGR